MDMRVDDCFGQADAGEEDKHLGFLLDEGLELLANYSSIRSLSVRASIRDLIKELANAADLLKQ